MVPNKVKILNTSVTRISYHLTDKPGVKGALILLPSPPPPTPLSALFVSASLYGYLNYLKLHGKGKVERRIWGHKSGDRPRSLSHRGPLTDYANPYREQMTEVRLVFPLKARKCFATKHVPLRRYCYTSETNKPGFKGKLTWSSKIHSLVSWDYCNYTTNLTHHF